MSGTEKKPSKCYWCAWYDQPSDKCRNVPMGKKHSDNCKQFELSKNITTVLMLNQWNVEGTLLRSKKLSDSDLQALGWVRAEPTDCRKCGLSQLLKLNPEAGYVCRFKGRWESPLGRGWGQKLICLDFLSQESSQGKPKTSEGEKHG